MAVSHLLMMSRRKKIADTNCNLIDIILNHPDIQTRLGYPIFFSSPSRQNLFLSSTPRTRKAKARYQIPMERSDICFSFFFLPLQPPTRRVFSSFALFFICFGYLKGLLRGF
jgi:hypothetical protein